MRQRIHGGMSVIRWAEILKWSGFADKANKRKVGKKQSKKEKRTHMELTAWCLQR